MAKEIRVPALGESVTEATIAKWFRQAGEAVKADEPLVELETDKVTVEVPAPASGKLSSIDAAPGTTVNVGALLGMIEEGAAGTAAAPAKAAEAPKKAEAPAPARQGSRAPLSPAVRKMVEENKVDTGPFPAPARMAASPRAT
jgi:2-oxoglutarate dehydrogenase E2 component (dihydrolipoamide succinyltransferase)